MIIDKVLKPKLKTTKPPAKAEENVKRSLLKTISWRLIGTLDTILISWAITGTLSLAFSIGFIELVTKMVLYYFHERIWNKINWGR